MQSGILTDAAIPFPPRNPRCDREIMSEDRILLPHTLPSSGSISDASLSQKSDCTSTIASTHFRQSPSSVIAPAFLPKVRRALVVPALPLPYSRISIPCIFPYNIGCLEKSKHISDQQDNTKRSVILSVSFPFLSRIINFREVPLKPNASRILFSRYLV